MILDSYNTLLYQGTRALVTQVLKHATKHVWSIQGFGMLRTYLDDDKVWRLNVWHNGLAVPRVSTIHDHPWDFQSLVVAGEFYNQRFVPDKPENSANPLVRLEHMRIKTGPGGGARGEPVPVALRQQSMERYCAGNIYTQRAEEVHQSSFLSGTVTLNKRARRADGEHANVYWPEGEQWVDAEPRDATEGEINYAVEAALRRNML